MEVGNILHNFCLESTTISEAARKKGAERGTEHGVEREREREGKLEGS